MTERRRDVLVGIGLVLFVLAAVAWPILAGELGPKAFDHRFFHLPLVREWAATWPIVNLRDYNSATGPLYHWIMAGAAQIVGTQGGAETSPALQLTSALFGGFVVVVTYAFARKCLPLGVACLAALCLACSPYLLGNAVWMMTDNLSLALAALTIGAAAFAPCTPTRTAGQGFVAALAVSTRQINLWLLAPIAIAVLVRSRLDRRAIVAAVVAAALVVGTLATFVLLWGGLVPPKFLEQHTSGLQPAALGYGLTLIAAYGVCLLPAARHGVRSLWSQPALLGAVFLVGAILGAAGESFATNEIAGRNGGWLWRSVAQLPVFAGRSALIVGGCGLGATVLVALYLEAKRAARANEALVVMTGLAGFLIAHVANAHIYQRYYDPMVLLTLVWLAALGTPRDERTPGATALAFSLLVAQQICFAAGVLYWPMRYA